jgi:glucokinase
LAAGKRAASRAAGDMPFHLRARLGLQLAGGVIQQMSCISP